MLEPGVAQVDLADEAVERLHLLDRVALDRGPQRLPDDAQQVDHHALAEQPVDLGLARAVAAHQPLERGRLVRRVVVDVHRRVVVEARHDPVDEPLERRGARRRARTRRRRRVTRWPRTPPLGVEEPEQVVEPVVEGVRVALDVEEQVARRGRRQRGQARARARSPRPAPGTKQLVAERARAPALELDPGLLADAQRARLRRPRSSGGSIGSGEVAERLERRDAALGQRAPLPRRDPGDEAEVIVLASTGDAFGRPAADVAVLDGLRVGRSPAGRRAASRRPASPGTGRGRSGSRPCSRRRADVSTARALPPSATWSHSGRTPWIRSSWSTYEQIWRTALALTWRASFVSATS